MELAGKKFIGEHVFRNFCMMDAVNILNYSRRFNHFDISCCDEKLDGNELWAITINGSAFVWHQVRCMVAVLYMIGQGVETPSENTSKGGIESGVHEKVGPHVPLMPRPTEPSYEERRMKDVQSTTHLI